ncbi:dipeptide ABC transporter ATP-binding protein [Microbacterium terricola]|uniref:ABC transporter ATP-binding protein n=1 Tax=Microbacterium terricola TaxID=344163 RepID=A0ABM8DYW0_9MICO|nr:ABC transporter ATP-binding protein [Microbacterium terricola]UYK41458.1 ABC transporter ATP-binding protein [Microbacterium terricola]BDV30752.1 ABC transporter ATP-binding protein [Microbacterium terricola]
MTALRVRNLHIAFGDSVVVDGVDLSVAPGECLAIVGESGAGKSLTARALLGLTPAGAAVTADALEVDGTDAGALGEAGWRRVRGARIALVSQDALVSLDPLRRIGAEVAEPLRLHERELTPAAREQRVEELLASVSMPDPAYRARQRPHELSGGLRQRALIASALAGRPAVLVADEPTTALDATVQARVLDLLRGIADSGVAVVFVSHDFAAVRRVADRIVVMRDGRFVEQGAAAAVLDDPQHPYTRMLVDATRHAPRAAAPAADDALLSVQGVSKSFDRPAVVDVSLEVARGRTLAIVGESGSGKTTLARMIVGVEQPDSGTVRIGGLAWRAGDDAALRRRVQFVHQNPLGAFDPRWSVARSLREALAAGGVPAAERQARVADLLREVDLDPALAGRRPAQLSGGQRQRAAIARALAVGPQLLVLDEPVSALDPSVRERVLALLRRLQEERDLTMLFVSHDLEVVASVADEVAVMQDGAVVELGPVAAVFAAPRHPFTKELLAAGR